MGSFGTPRYSKDDMDIKSLKTEKVYQGSHMMVEQATIETTDGRTVTWETVKSRNNGVVAVVALKGNKVCLVRQYRHPALQTLWELPAGGIDPGELSYSAAQRELAEEIGLFPTQILSLGTYYASPGYTAETIELFLARTLVVVPDHKPELDIEHDWFDQIEIRELFAKGEIKDMKTVAGLGLTGLLNTFFPSGYLPS